MTEYMNQLVRHTEGLMKGLKTGGVNMMRGWVLAELYVSGSVIVNRNIPPR